MHWLFLLYISTSFLYYSLYWFIWREFVIESVILSVILQIYNQYFGSFLLSQGPIRGWVSSSEQLWHLKVLCHPSHTYTHNGIHFLPPRPYPQAHKEPPHLPVQGVPYLHGGWSSSRHGPWHFHSGGPEGHTWETSTCSKCQEQVHDVQNSQCQSPRESEWPDCRVVKETSLINPPTSQQSYRCRAGCLHQESVEAFVPETWLQTHDVSYRYFIRRQGQCSVNIPTWHHVKAPGLDSTCMIEIFVHTITHVSFCWAPINIKPTETAAYRLLLNQRFGPFWTSDGLLALVLFSLINRRGNIVIIWSTWGTWTWEHLNGSVMMCVCVYFCGNRLACCQPVPASACEASAVC